MHLSFLALTGCGAEQAEEQGNTESTGGTTVEETTVAKTTEETTAGPLVVSPDVMSEEEDEDRDRDRRVVASPSPNPEPTPKAKEEPEPKPNPEPKDAPPPAPQPAPEPEEASEPEEAPEQSSTECRSFSQSDFVQAGPEEKSFIGECDRAQGKTGFVPTPSEPGREEGETAVPAPTPPVAPSPSGGGGGLTCEGLSDAEAAAALPTNPQLNGNDDGESCE